MEPIRKLVADWGFQYQSDNSRFGHAMGIGDLLFRLLCQQEQLLPKPMYINVDYFVSSQWYANPLQMLKFRLGLLKDILSHHQSLTLTDVVFISSHRMYLCQDIPYAKLTNFRLALQPSFYESDSTQSNPYGSYVVFHTKLRLLSQYNYADIKKEIRQQCQKLKCRSKIILMGERTFPRTVEAQIHGITTIYGELLELKANNEVIDLSVEDIHSDMNYKSYKRDLSLIRGAQFNVCIGVGGHLCTSLIFGRVLSCMMIDSGFNVRALQENGHWNFPDLTGLFQSLL